MSGPGKLTVTHRDNRLVSITVTDEFGKEQTITEGALTWYKVRPTIQDFLAGYPVRLFGQLALAESLSGESRRNTLKSIFREDHEEVFRAYKMLIHNCFTEKGFHIPGGVLTSETHANDVLIARPTGEKAINVGAIDEKFGQWIHAEIENKPLTGLQNEVYRLLFMHGGNTNLGRKVCQLVTVLFLIDGTIVDERELHGVGDRYNRIFGEIFPEELPTDLDLRFTKDEVLRLCYELRNSLKKLGTHKEIDLRFVQNDYVFEIPVKQNGNSKLIIYAENLYKKLVAYIEEWEATNRSNPDYMPNRIERSFDFDN